LARNSAAPRACHPLDQPPCLPELEAGFLRVNAEQPTTPCFPLRQHKATKRAHPYGWVSDNSDHSARVSVVDFDYETVFQQLDGDVSEAKSSAPDAVPLMAILSPRELRHAYTIAQTILRKSSPGARATRAAWRDPVKRQQWSAAIRRAAQNPEVQRKKSASLRRAWKIRDREPMRDQMLRLWRERRPEMVAKIRAATCSAKFRQRASEHCRAIWANPILRQKFLAVRRTPEARRRTGLASCRYYAEHPEAGLRAAERARAMWRKPGFRSRRRQAIAARKVPDPSLSKTE